MYQHTSSHQWLKQTDSTQTSLQMCADVPCFAAVNQQLTTFLAFIAICCFQFRPNQIHGIQLNHSLIGVSLCYCCWPTGHSDFPLKSFPYYCPLNRIFSWSRKNHTFFLFSWIICNLHSWAKRRIFPIKFIDKIALNDWCHSNTIKTLEWLFVSPRKQTNKMIRALSLAR